MNQVNESLVKCLINYITNPEVTSLPYPLVKLVSAQEPHALELALDDVFAALALQYREEYPAAIPRNIRSLVYCADAHLTSISAKKANGDAPHCLALFGAYLMRQLPEIRRTAKTAEFEPVRDDLPS